MSIVSRARELLGASDTTRDERANAPTHARRPTDARPLHGRVDAIVIGASAGGIEALTVLLPALPASLVVPVFVVLHLPRARPSLLVEIYTSKCRLALRDADDKEPVRGGTVYFAPSDYHLLVDRVQPWLAAPTTTGTMGTMSSMSSIETMAASVASRAGGEKAPSAPSETGPLALPPCQIALSADEPVHYSRPSIDRLFESAADAYGSRLLAIVLTGANQDGAEGLAAVHAANGITVVQSPGEAQSTAMPNAAMSRVQPNHVLPLAGIAALLRSLSADGSSGATLDQA